MSHKDNVLMNTIVQLPAHTKMTVSQCLNYCKVENLVDGAYQDIIIVAYNRGGDLVIRSSSMNRADATFMLLKAVDYSKG